MPAQTANRERIAARRADVAHLYCQGWTQSRIAAKHGVSQNMISVDLAYIRRQWRATMTERYDALLDEQLGKVDACEREAWDAWERSKQNAKRKTTKGKAVRGPDGRYLPPDAPQVETVTEGQCGDPRYLTIVLQCVERRCKMIGAEAPPPIPPEQLNDEQVLTRIIGHLRAHVAQRPALPPLVVEGTEGQAAIVEAREGSANGSVHESGG
jgi:hypothetical protein